MILACSGGSNVGQVANQAAAELTQEGLGNWSIRSLFYHKPRLLQVVTM
jgi:uncharacterized metal-binding protein